MKNKRAIIILLAIIVLTIIVIVGFIKSNQSKSDNEMPTTGAFNETRFTVNEYSILVKSDVAGHPSADTDFSTNYISDTYIRENYKFRYDIYIDMKFSKESIYNEYPSYDSMKMIKVFDKKFKYQEISTQEILLLYKVDESFYITISLKDRSECYGLDGNYIYDENRNEVMLEKYNFLEFIEENKEFNDSFKFEISKD